MIQAIGSAISGDLPKAIFDALAEDDGEASAAYERYKSERRFQQASGPNMPGGFG